MFLWCLIFLAGSLYWCILSCNGLLCVWGCFEMHFCPLRVAMEAYLMAKIKK